MLVPVIVGILLWVFALPSAVAAGLAMLTAAPGAPLTTKRAELRRLEQTPNQVERVHLTQNYFINTGAGI